MNIPYIVFIVISLALGLGTQWYINHTYKKWSKVDIDSRETGSNVAQRFLSSEGLTDVPIRCNNGKDLSDYYDPRNNTLYLTKSSMTKNTVADVAVSCHEAGHAVQHAKGYMPARIRMRMAPVTNFISRAWIIVLVIGMLLNVMGLVTLAIILFALVLVFDLVTLPVEFNASSLAINFLSTDIRISEEQAYGARKVLTAAALTYVASALSSILQLLYLLGRSRN